MRDVGCTGKRDQHSAFPRALLAESLLTLPVSLHAFLISTPAVPSTELMNNGRPVIRLISEPSLSLTQHSESKVWAAPSALAPQPCI